MANIRNNGDACKDVQPLLSDYTDNSLSARHVWAVEKHLAGCSACASEARELRATVDLLRSIARLDTSTDFMAALHARLDTVEPSSLSAWQRLKSWLADSGGPVIGRRVPALGLSLAAAAAALTLVMHRPMEPAAVVASAVPQAADSVHISVASSASSPFSDPAADNLEFRSSARGAGQAGVL